MLCCVIWSSAQGSAAPGQRSVWPVVKTALSGESTPWLPPQTLHVRPIGVYFETIYDLNGVTYLAEVCRREARTGVEAFHGRNEHHERICRSRIERGLDAIYRSTYSTCMEESMHLQAIHLQNDSNNLHCESKKTGPLFYGL